MAKPTFEVLFLHSLAMQLALAEVVPGFKAAFDSWRADEELRALAKDAVAMPEADIEAKVIGFDLRGHRKNV